MTAFGGSDDKLDQCVKKNFSDSIRHKSIIRYLLRTFSLTPINISNGDVEVMKSMNVE